jgi:UDP-glucuronate 4-epimerase
MTRDFTYVDDVVEAICRLSARPPERGGANAPYRVINVGGGNPEQAVGKKAIRRDLPMQPGDVPATWARSCSNTLLASNLARD